MHNIIVLWLNFYVGESHDKEICGLTFVMLQFIGLRTIYFKQYISQNKRYYFLLYFITKLYHFIKYKQGHRG